MTREEELESALKLARAYMDVSLGSPSWDGPNPYPIIDAALALSRPYRHVDDPGLAHPDNSDSPAWAVPSQDRGTE